MILRRKLRELVAWTYWAGSGLSGRLRQDLNPDISILMYHRVVNPREGECFPPSHSGVMVNEDTFEMQMRYLRENFEVLPLDALVSSMKDGRKRVKRRCAITFDDGWKDNLDYAFAVLKKYQLPATIFLATRFINSSHWPWQEKLIFLIEKILSGGKFQALREGFPEMLSRNFSKKLFNPGEWKFLSDEMVEKASEMVPEQRDRLIQALSAWVPESLGQIGTTRVFLNWEEIRKMRAEGIAFGAHGVSHEWLTRMTTQEIEAEIAGSKADIEKHLGGNVRAFCYPNGRYDSRAMEVLKRLGFHYACTTEFGYNNPETDPYALRRISVHNDISYTLPLFICRLRRLL